MESDAAIEDFDIIEDDSASSGESGEAVMIHQFVLVTGLRHLAHASEPKRMVAWVTSNYGISANRLLGGSVYGLEARNVAIWLAWQKSSLTLREIGSMFGGVDYAAVSQLSRRLQKRADSDKKLKRTLEMLNVRYDPMPHP